MAGVRTFETGYDPSGQIYEWGANDMQRIYRLCKAHDDLQSRWSQPDVRHRQRYRLQRAARRLRARIRNLVDDLQGSRRCSERRPPTSLSNPQALLFGASPVLGVHDLHHF
jgi:hypothetical protein